MASTTLTESEAAFRKQAANLGLHQDWITGLVDVGVSNLGRLAFACGQPGSPTADADVTTLLTNTGVLRGITVGDIAIMKRLIFEAQTSVISLVRAQADPNADPSVRKLPAAERTARIVAQKARLAGLNLEGPLEVAHSLYDVVSGMMEADSLKYLPPNKCITRLSEITSAKPPKELKLDSNASGIVVREGSSEQTCATTTELDIYEAMTRRSLAFDAVGLVQYEVFQKWVGYMFQLLRQAPPPGFSAPTITQMLRTDRQAFVRVQELTRDGIRPLPTGDRPLDAVIRNLEGDHNVIYYMLPTPAAKEKPAKKQPTDEKKSDKEYKWNKWTPKQSQWNKSQGSGKLPEALKGCASATKDGKRICFGYNIDGCDKAQAGERCEKGYHLCAGKDCGGKHPYYSCNNKK